MKFNQWTLALAAVGAVSLVSAARADEAKISQVQTALSSTTLSGYVDVAAQYNLGNVNANEDVLPPTASGAGNSAQKVDNFTLNDVDIALDKPEDDSPWASGYHVDLNFGSDAVEYYGTTADNNDDTFGIRQAYLVLRTPIGSGIDWKIGIQDNIIGYEGNTDSANPNYTRSYGYSLEPTTLLGAIGTYTVNKFITVEAGIVNDSTVTPEATSAKGYVGDIAFTAPTTWGWVSGATLNLGINAQMATDGTYHNAENYFAGLTVPTPWSALKFGAAFDLLSYSDKNGVDNPKDDSEWVAGLYANYQATDKLSLNLRGEYLKNDVDSETYPYAFDTDASGNQAEEVTATVQYNLWANVTSRAEFRWDHVAHGTQFGAEDGQANAYLLALNLIYTF